MSSEKELNVHLLYMRDTIEDALEVAKEGDTEKTLAFLEKALKRVEQKLYQNPPLTTD